MTILQKKIQQYNINNKPSYNDNNLDKITNYSPFE